MSGNIIREWHFWLASIATGACMAFAYDLLRLFRRLVRHGRFAVDLEDILYWSACFVISFSLLYYGNNGVIRFAAVFGAAIGMCIYILTLGRVFVRFSFFIIDKTIGNLIRLIAKIMNFVYKKIAGTARKAAGKWIRLKNFFISKKIKLTQKLFQNTIIKKQSQEGKRKEGTRHGKPRRHKKTECGKKKETKKNP